MNLLSFYPLTAGVVLEWLPGFSMTEAEAPRPQTKALGPRRAPRGRQKQVFSTAKSAKDILEKLKPAPLHPLPGENRWFQLTLTV